MTNNPPAEPYLVGGNLLNEQENVQKVKQQHEKAEPEAADSGEGDTPDAQGAAAEPAGPREGTITDEQLTHGGGAVPPGSLGEGNAQAPSSAKGLDYTDEQLPGEE